MIQSVFGGWREKVISATAQYTTKKKKKKKFITVCWFLNWSNELLVSTKYLLLEEVRPVWKESFHKYPDFTTAFDAWEQVVRLRCRANPEFLPSKWLMLVAN